LDPEKMTLVSENIDDQINQVFLNLRAVCEAAGGDLSNIVKLNIFLTDLDNFSIVNEIMSQFFTEPYPARAAIGVKSLPKGSKVEMDGVVVI
jgi:reactive intermediate/imine deaminase